MIQAVTISNIGMLMYWDVFEGTSTKVNGTVTLFHDHMRLSHVSINLYSNLLLVSRLALSLIYVQRSVSYH